MNYPLEKYHFYVTKDKVIAISTYEGRRVRGVAKCDPGDTFDVEKGKRLAAARCNAKIALKRYNRARRKRAEALEAATIANNYYDRMVDYAADAKQAIITAHNEVEDLLKTM